MSLSEAVDYALANSLSMRNAQLEVADAEALIRERKASGLPNLSAGANYQRYLAVPKQPLPQDFVEFFKILNPNGEIEGEVSFFRKNNFTSTVDLDMMIFDGTYFAALQAAKAARAYAQLQLQQQRRVVRINTSNAYLPVLLLQENVDQLAKNLDNLERLLYETRQTYEAGFAEQLDVDRLELSLANLQTERDNLERQREVALRNLKYAINYPLDQPLSVEDSLDNMAIEAAAAELTGDIPYDRRPELQTLEQAIVLNELNVKVNRAAYLPTLRGTGAFQYQYQGDSFSDGFWAPTAFLGLNLRVPIFDGFYKKALIQRAQIDLEQARLQSDDLRRMIELEVRNARTDYLNARERLAARRRSQELAERIYETTQIKYREGVGSSLEVSQAEQSLYDAQSNYLQALFDLLSAKTTLEQALGY